MIIRGSLVVVRLARCDSLTAKYSQLNVNTVFAGFAKTRGYNLVMRRVLCVQTKGIESIVYTIVER